MHIQELHQLFLSCDQRICTDTRNIVQDGIFFALKGENFNGNNFAHRAIETGAKYAVVDDPQLEGKSTAMVLVPDVLTTLQQLAAYHRSVMKAKVIGLTGSNGKTTSKELIQAVLSRRFSTLATIGNLNNHIGVPLTLLRLREEHEVAVIEMGANHQLEIAKLCEIADPDIGVITNIGKAHIGTMGGMEGIIKTKCELYDHLRFKDGIVFVPSSQKVLLDRSNGLKRTTYGLDGDEDVIGEGSASPAGNVHFRWRHAGSEFGSWISTHLVGGYNIDNCLAAVAIGTHFGATPTEVSDAIAQYIPTNHRSQQIEVDGVCYIMDAYNANPSSMAEALKSLAKRDGRKGFILGEMLELGDYSEQEHQAILDQALAMDPALAVFVGEGFRPIAERDSRALWVADAAQARSILDSTDLKGMTVLIKGSRRNRLEYVLETGSNH